MVAGDPKTMTLIYGDEVQTAGSLVADRVKAAYRGRTGTIETAKLDTSAKPSAAPSMSARLAPSLRRGQRLSARAARDGATAPVPSARGFTDRPPPWAPLVTAA